MANFSPSLLSQQDMMTCPKIATMGQYSISKTGSTSLLDILPLYGKDALHLKLYHNIMIHVNGTQVPSGWNASHLKTLSHVSELILVTPLAFSNMMIN